MAWDTWDDEVDVVCTGAGLAGLATAIAALDEGAEVFVAGAPVGEKPETSGQGSWFRTGDDEATRTYLHALTEDIDVENLPHGTAQLPTRTAQEPAAVSGRQTEPPFFGSRLRDWAAQCLASPSGYLYTRVTDWPSTTMESAVGSSIEVAEIGSLAVDSDDVVGSVHTWLSEEAHERGVRVQPVDGFDRLVLEEGGVVGVVFATPEGWPWAIRARHGVLLCSPGTPVQDLPRATVATTVLRVALVGVAASRFGRVELLA